MKKLFSNFIALIMALWGIVIALMCIFVITFGSAELVYWIITGNWWHFFETNTMMVSF